MRALVTDGIIRGAIDANHGGGGRLDNIKALTPVRILVNAHTRLLSHFINLN